jgi:hypothetical protein
MQEVRKLYVEVNGVRFNHPFSFVSRPKFSDDGKTVMFGIEEGGEFKWMVYQISGNQLVEK